MQQRLIAEWEPQDAVLLTWPHANTDWDYMLDRVLPLYQSLVLVIAEHAKVVIAVPEEIIVDVAESLMEFELPDDAVHLYPCPSNDTWARDHGPLTVQTESGLKMLDFTFTGWGGKFNAELDDRITATLHGQGAFPGAALEKVELILEGGGIEVDGQGTLLTTEACLLNPNRNTGMGREDIEAVLKAQLGVRKVNWLKHGYLAGDDTDSHIDTLARLCPDNTIAYQQCDDPDDEHYQALSAMEAELKAMTDADGKPYRLVPLPWPSPKYDDEANRLPATYANFLIINGAVLVPTYDDDRDEEALVQVAHAFPGYQVMGIPCFELIEQHGSLHCITMQLPKGVLSAS
ncbi:agmatine deiminase family protein [Gallaecimonas sp. GXIMD4217]|uniref:agmatine deiminase family protein n=1 Tax=Gallaecimonas sp. GXIMD4217 TaxID=3131927 RepID=UPI00311B14AE